jgi:hypothetical protein
VLGKYLGKQELQYQSRLRRLYNLELKPMHYFHHHRHCPYWVFLRCRFRYVFHFRRHPFHPFQPMHCLMLSHHRRLRREL